VNTPERSAAIARALASGSECLPEDFAARVAAVAAAERASRWSWDDAALLVAFVAMIGGCVAGGFRFTALEFGGIEWIGDVFRTLASNPWLAIGVAGVAIVQMLTYRRRLSDGA
jgi:hypothetical protein